MVKKYFQNIILQTLKTLCGLSLSVIVDRIPFLLCHYLHIIVNNIEITSLLIEYFFNIFWFKMLHNLPPELYFKILSHLSQSECLSLRLCCTSWNELVYKLLYSKLTYFIDDKRRTYEASNDEHSNFVVSVTKLSSENFDIIRICFRNYNLFKEIPNLDVPLRQVLSNADDIRIEDCELSSKFLCFLLNRVRYLERLRLKAIFDKSPECKVLQLGPNVFQSLIELNLSHSSGMDDQTFAKLCIGMHNLQILNCVHCKMALYPNYMRRYYTRYNDLEECWFAPINFGFTFNIVRAFLTFTASHLKQIHIGPNISIDNVLELIKFDSLQDIHLQFSSDWDLENFEERVLSFPTIKASNKRIHFDITKVT